MIERAAKSKSAVSTLLEEFNDIDIYVEDTALESKKIYTEMINRVFKDEFNIENVIPLGPSDQVIKEWRNIQNNQDKRKKVFIIDGDYHLLNNSLAKQLTAEELKYHKGLFVLPRYCVENYLIDPKAFIEIIYEEVPADDRETIENKLECQTWYEKNNSLLSNLFVYNAISHHFDIGEKTSKYKVSYLINPQSPGICCKTLVEARIIELKKTIQAKKPTVNLIEEYNDRLKKLTDKGMLKVVTGKDYLFPLIKQYIATKYNCLNMSHTSLKIRLAKICDIQELLPIKQELF